ncbi:MAG: peptide deformylase [Verrucomicrobia bacterium]|nr:MAG: peptide deformylase [Verrucomicrobiota bacterium]
MVLEVVTYGHPALRSKGRKVAEIDDRLRRLAADMVDTMREKNGVGLAAQQVGVSMQLFVLEVLQNEERPGKMWKNGQESPFDHLMPLVVINPEIEPEGEIESEQEGCLSFPDVFGEVPRPSRVRLRALGLDGQPIDFLAGGLLARAIQHEYDHLQGTLFIDRMDAQTRRELEPAIAMLSRSNTAFPE